MASDFFDAFYGKSQYADDMSMFFLNFRPKLSPNGRYLLVPGLTVYPEYGIESTGTWLIDLVEGVTRQLFSDGKIVTWNPTSDAITYIEGDTLYTLGIAEGATPTSHFQNTGLWPLYAHWSPDGQWIATVTGAPHRPTGEDQADLTLTYWLVPTDGGTARKLTVQKDFAMEYASGEMSWSPDGQYLLMRNEVFDLGGNQLSPERSGSLNWLPNDSRLLMNSREGLRIVTIGGEEIARISDTYAGAWAFSHDGRRLAYTQDGEAEAQILAVYDLEKGTSQTIGPGTSAPLRWSADDNHLLMSVYRDNRLQVVAVSVESGGHEETFVDEGLLIEVVPYPPAGR